MRLQLENSAGTNITWINETIIESTGINGSMYGNLTTVPVAPNAITSIGFPASSCKSGSVYNATIGMWFALTNIQGTLAYQSEGSVAGTAS